MSSKDLDLKRFDRFIEGWSKTTTNSADYALIILMRHHREGIAPLFAARDPHWLHKAFRQTDVCDAAHVDMMVWHLIHASRDFWDEVHFFFSDERDPQGKRALAKQLALAEAQIEDLRQLLGQKEASNAG